MNNDRWNTLFRLNHLQIQPSPGQVTLAGQIPDFRQRTTLFSLDTNYDLNRHFTLGVKYGFALRSIQPVRDDSIDFFDSNVTLGVIRVDYHVVHKWDALIEYRRLSVTGVTGSERDGFLIGIFRHLDRDSRLRVGVGYNFSDFTDDLTVINDFSFRGWFINISAGF